LSWSFNWRTSGQTSGNGSVLRSWTLCWQSVRVVIRIRRLVVHASAVLQLPIPITITTIAVAVTWRSLSLVSTSAIVIDMAHETTDAHCPRQEHLLLHWEFHWAGFLPAGATSFNKLGSWWWWIVVIGRGRRWWVVVSRWCWCVVGLRVGVGGCTPNRR